jgi:hypothetical protein
MLLLDLVTSSRTDDYIMRSLGHTVSGCISKEAVDELGLALLQLANE